MRLDVLIFGGGAAGLWLLDELTRCGARVLLLEADRLGQGQTVASQGIIHGGLKYTLQGLLTRSAVQIREMPRLWRECLAGRQEPDLSGVRLRSECCYLWQTGSVASRLGMIGARFGLRVAPRTLATAERPTPLAGCPGTVARLDEPVICPAAFLTRLADRHRSHILQIDAACGISFALDGPGKVRSVALTNPAARSADEPAARMKLEPRYVVFTAGAGNAGLRRQAGLSDTTMQRRPLHMVLVHGRLPLLNGHCVDGAKTRVTVTSDTDAQGRTVWQVGGQLAEEGVALDAPALVARARAELQAVLPALDLADVEWAAYRVDRAEQAVSGGMRPDTAQVIREGNVLTAWPTKLALAPQLASEVAAQTGPFDPSAPALAVPAEWPRPVVAPLPWESVGCWFRVASDGVVREAAQRRAA